MIKIENFRNLPITTKFILWFLFVAMVPLIVATSISYNSSREVLKDEIANSLLAVADNKANQIEAYLREKEENVTALSRMPDVVEAIEKFRAVLNKGIDSAEYSVVDKEYRPLLSYHQKLFGYDDLFLISPDGDIIFSVKEKEGLRSLYEIALYKDSEPAKLFIKIKGTFLEKTEVSDFEYYPETKEGAVFIAAPVTKGPDLVGIIILQMSNAGVSELVQDYTGLGRTGETIIASKIKDEAVFITPLRFDPEAAFRRKIPLGSKEGLDIQKAAQGEKGSGVSVDYRGKEVLSVWKYLPSFRWGMAVKMDTAEVFTSADRLRNTLLTISLVLLILVAIMAVLIAHSVSSPIKQLTETSGIIAGGDLTARAKVEAKDEIGELASTFTQMTDSLVEAKANVEQKRDELEEQKKLLEKANKELDSFVYTASHDLRAPLRGIASFASFLEEDYRGKLDEEGKDYLKEIREGTSRMDRLIEDLLKLSRISRIKNPYEDTDINGLMDSVIKRIEFDIKEKGVDLKIQKDLPAIKCDPIKISEVFLNLINNGIKFSSKNNKDKPKVEIGYADEDESHKFFVKDNGIGIDPKYHAQIFGIFKRLHTADEYEGTGAGLSIVKRVIDDHNGKIWVESEAGKGAAFYFTIPKDIEKKKKRIGEILVEDGLISEEELKKRLKRQGGREIGPPEYKGEI